MDSKKKNLFDDSDGEEEEFNPNAGQPAAVPEQPPVEAPTEASVAPVQDPSQTAEKPSLFDDDEDAYVPPSEPAAAVDSQQIEEKPAEDYQQNEADMNFVSSSA